MLKVETFLTDEALKDSELARLLSTQVKVIKGQEQLGGCGPAAKPVLEVFISKLILMSWNS